MAFIHWWWGKTRAQCACAHTQRGNHNQNSFLLHSMLTSDIVMCAVCSFRFISLFSSICFIYCEHYCYALYYYVCVCVCVSFPPRNSIIDIHTDSKFGWAYLYLTAFIFPVVQPNWLSQALFISPLLLLLFFFLLFAMIKLNYCVLYTVCSLCYYY